MVKTPMFPLQGGTGSIPGRGIKILRAVLCGEKKKTKQSKREVIFFIIQNIDAKLET